MNKKFNMVKSGKGNSRFTDKNLETCYRELADSGQELRYLPPKSYTVQDLIDYATEGRIYRPVAVKFGLI
jgi:hypothetical protein